MTLKTHLFIVSAIIIVLYFITQVLVTTEEKAITKAPIEQPKVISAYNITISRASWGLNCKPFSATKTYNKNPAASNIDEELNDSGKIKNNNVIYSVSKLCNGKPKCDILIDPTVLGEDPFPSCAYKELQVEYRCFSIDYLRKAKTMDGILTIDCDKQVKLP